jgi:hypothetical protein
MSSVEKSESQTERQRIRELIAVHELGHAVGTREAGLTPGEIRVKDYWLLTGSYGYCEVREDVFPTDAEGNTLKSVMRGYMVMLLAGQEAVDYLAELRGEKTHFTAESDYHSFKEWSQEVDLSLEEGKALARSLVVAHWGEIMQWCDRLVDRGRLAGKKVM